MSIPLSALDLSHIPEPSPPHVSSPVHSLPLSQTCLPYNQVPQSTIDVWVPQSQPHQHVHPIQTTQQQELRDTPDPPLIRTSSSTTGDLFSFLQPTSSPLPQPHPQSPSPLPYSNVQSAETYADLPDNPTNPVVSEPSVLLERSLPEPCLAPPQSVGFHTSTQPMSSMLTQSDRMIYTAPLRTNTTTPSQKAHLAAPLVASMLTAAKVDGMSAVERAKKNADQFTMSELAKKRKASGRDSDPKRPRNLSSSKSSTEDDEKDPENHSEKVSHRKYQKRLQKNRDSAYVSRIRRREYTRLLEESLANTEKEKDAAVSSFFEMRRRFDIVSAELSAFKQAAAANLSAVKTSLFNYLPSPTSDTRPVRSGSVVTSMFMFTMLFGFLLPDCIRQRLGLQRHSAESDIMMQGFGLSTDTPQQDNMHSMFMGNTFSQHVVLANETRGKVWGQPSLNEEVGAQLHNFDNSCHEGILNKIQKLSSHILGERHSDSFVKLVQPHVERLSTEQRAKLDDVFLTGNTTRYQQLTAIEELARNVRKRRSGKSRTLLERVTQELENARL